MIMFLFLEPVCLINYEIMFKKHEGEKTWEIRKLKLKLRNFGLAWFNFFGFVFSVFRVLSNFILGKNCIGKCVGSF